MKQVNNGMHHLHYFSSLIKVYVAWSSIAFDASELVFGYGTTPHKLWGIMG